MDSSDLHTVAWYLIPAGIAAGLVAAVPGLIDYFATVPPDSSARRRATLHLLVNVSALGIFALAWWLRGGPAVAPEPPLLGLEVLGALALSVGGWMGGTLAFRNQIGVDHRYSNAGKWSEERLEARKDGWTRVARADELDIDQMKLLHLGKRRIVLARSRSGWAAFADHCTHRGGSLAGGLIACDTVICPWHGSQFDVRTGSVAAGPATTSISVFAVEVRDGEVWLNTMG
jgi:nitrite reductase/ring-hydroxylating ferredoxin subunit/uncharacterized membrane protein